MADSPYTKLTREVIAEREVGKTQIARPVSVIFVAAFLFTIISVPIVQQVLDSIRLRGEREVGVAKSV